MGKDSSEEKRVTDKFIKPSCVLALKSATEWRGSMFQVVIEGYGGVVVLLMVVYVFLTSLSVESLYINIECPDEIRSLAKRSNSCSCNQHPPCAS
jgi:hypothetical protein